MFTGEILLRVDDLCNSTLKLFRIFHNIIFDNTIKLLQRYLCGISYLRDAASSNIITMLNSSISRILFRV